MPRVEPQPTQSISDLDQSARCQSRSSSGRSGIVIAALGLQILFCTVVSAAQACTGTLDRLEDSVAHAIRDIVDRQAVVDVSYVYSASGYRFEDTPLIIAGQSGSPKSSFISMQNGPMWLNRLPPPTL